MKQANTQPAVAIENASGSVVTTDTSNVKLSLTIDSYTYLLGLP